MSDIVLLQGAYFGRNLPWVLAIIGGFSLMVWVYSTFFADYEFFSTYSPGRKIFTILTMIIAVVAEAYFLYWLLNISQK